MEKKKIFSCPICKNNSFQNILNLNCGNLDNSHLYKILKIVVCDKCGHIYNLLTEEQMFNLLRYYEEEYGPLNVHSQDKEGDRPGSNNSLTENRHAQLYQLIERHINSNFKVLDIGCAMGGFLNFLNKKGLSQLYGIDPISKYVEGAKKKRKLNIKKGSAENIPFEDNTFDLLVMDQVMEHLHNPSNSFKEARRVLKKGGLFCIGLPDATRYRNNYFFDFYWFILREHIQHFDIEHLKLLGEQEGFQLLDYSFTNIPMMKEKMVLPNLNVVFKFTNSKINPEINNDYFKLKANIINYISEEFQKLDKKKKIIDEIYNSGKKIFIWGIGREFLFLYENTNLKNCDIQSFIDINEYKQSNFLINGKKIEGKKVLENANPDSLILITAVSHSTIIKKSISTLNYLGTIIEF